MFFLGEGLVTCIAFAILSCSNPTHLVGVGRRSGLPESGGVNEPERYPRQDTGSIPRTSVQMIRPMTGIDKQSCSLAVIQLAPEI
jgi:hypothetical protein